MFGSAHSLRKIAPGASSRAPGLADRTEAERVAPTGVGPHVALPLFAAAFAWEGKTVFWRYAAPVLAAYAVGSPFLFRTGAMALLPHAMAGLLGWLIVRLWPYRLSERVAEEPAPVGLGLRS